MNKLGNRKKVSFIVTQVPDLSDRGSNMAIKVYETCFKTGNLTMIGANYRINTASWKGARGAGIDIIASVYSDLKHTAYLIKDDRVINYQEI